MLDRRDMLKTLGAGAATDYVPRGIRANSVCMANTATPMVEAPFRSCANALVQPARAAGSA